MNVVREIIAEEKKANRTPIIIVQGDHGTHSTGYISTDTPGEDLLAERYGILNTYYVPESIRAKEE